MNFFLEGSGYGTLQSLRKNENGICTKAEIQAVAKFLLIIICKKKDEKDVVLELEQRKGSQ